MRIAFLVAAHRFTGAAAVAEHWCRALSEIGEDTGLFFREGGNLQWRLEGCAWAHPVLLKERTPADLLHNLRHLRHVSKNFDALISFLPHDQVLALLAGIRKEMSLVRAFRHPKHLKADPFNALLARRCDAAILPFRSLEPVFRSLAPDTPIAVFPAAVEARFHARENSGSSIPDGIPVLGMVGKVAAGRGFEDAVDILAAMKQPCRMLLVGHGEAEEDLKDRARRAGVLQSILFKGKQESALPELFRSMSLLLFTAPGSDWGHRVISEAHACGVPVVTRAMDGVEDLVTDGENGIIVEDGGKAMVTAIEKLLQQPERLGRLREGALRAAETRRFKPVARQLKDFLLKLC